jgi:hypothetical protein
LAFPRKFEGAQKSPQCLLEFNASKIDIFAKSFQNALVFLFRRAKIIAQLLFVQSIYSQ